MSLRGWVEPHSSDERIARQEQLINILALGGTAAGLAYFIIALATFLLGQTGNEVPWASLAGGAGCAGLSLLSYWVCRRGWMSVASIIVVSAASLIGLFAVHTRGSFTVDVIVLTPAIIFAGVALGTRAAALTVLAQIILYGTMAWFEWQGLFPPLLSEAENSPWTAIGITVVTMAVLVVILQQTTAVTEAHVRRIAERGQVIEAMAAEKDRLLVALQGREEAQQRLLDTVHELGSPIIPLGHGILALPLIGSVDSVRAQDIISTLFQGVAEHRARVVLIDITGVPMVDTAVAGALLQAAQGVRLLGAEAVLTGIRAEVAQTIVSLGLDMQEIETRAGLREGLEYALERAGVHLVEVES